ncbi:MAG: hypothetical protein EOO40_05700 [Deltaproteobacteria bacterium]|nr:MAG: hypothetical protein EOO40_05700 [Deltaproteobacteria bacterium]
MGVGPANRPGQSRGGGAPQEPNADGPPINFTDNKERVSYLEDAGIGSNAALSAYGSNAKGGALSSSSATFESQMASAISGQVPSFTSGADAMNNRAEGMAQTAASMDAEMLGEASAVLRDSYAQAQAMLSQILSVLRIQTF